jgi:hypothetical protein
MRAAFLVVIVLGAARHSLLAQCGEEPAAPWSLMNATLERIAVDTNSSRDDKWRDASLPPSNSVAFDGELTRVKVRLKSGRVLRYEQREIALIQHAITSSAGRLACRSDRFAFRIMRRAAAHISASSEVAHEKA